MTLRRIAPLALLLALVAAAPARAVVGGHPLALATAPWFASFGGCGGALVAPDRVLTAGHCVAHRELADLRNVAVGGVLRQTVRFAMYPAWRHANGTSVRDDVAIVQLDQPVPGVAPVTLGGGLPAEATILGRGRSTVPAAGERASPRFRQALRAAQLRLISDARCARSFRDRRGSGGERFDAARMLCAVDVDGRPPLSSACNGDAGGPLYAATPGAPVLLGVVSFSGARCGADGLPSVFTDVARYRRFVANPFPRWAPTPESAPEISGTAAVGRHLTCAVSTFTTPPARVAVSWHRQGGRRAKLVGRRATYTVRRADAGHQLACEVEASNDGGIAGSITTLVRIPR
ncbi:MAG TPA: serine protease [Solirubrobacteraceae bacterium]